MMYDNYATQKYYSLGSISSLIRKFGDYYD